MLCAARACRRLFATLLRRGELMGGSLPAEEDVLSGERGGRAWGRGRESPGVGASAPRLSLPGNSSAEDKYKAWMRHRYNDCVECLSELLGHDSFRVKVSCGLCWGTGLCGRSSCRSVRDAAGLLGL